MNQYQTFIFDSYDFDAPARTIRLHYSLDGIVPFTETIRLPDDMPLDESHPDLDRALFALHLIGGISYYKTCLPPEIEIRSGTLTATQARFWNEIYEKGLGEFFYRNDIDFRGMINFPATSPTLNPSPDGRGTVSPLSPVGGKGSGDRGRNSVLVPVGGGKDSTVTTELLKSAGQDVTLLRVGRHALIDTFAQKANLPLWNTGRGLAPQLFTLNAEGALNGHVPITAYLHFLSVVIALLSGRTHVAFSDERSADEGNVEFHGMEINHQWSKGIEFEQQFQQYLAMFVTADVTCFSLLRPLSELKITELFCQHPDYLDICTSCNRNWQILSKDPNRPRWCGTCPKCAFVFAMLAAFVPRERLEETFGGNLFANEALAPLYRELLGLQGSKPFECVGTPEETAAAFLLARKQDKWEDTPIMQLFMQEALPSIQDEEALIAELMKASDSHCIPEEFRSTVL